MKSQDCISYEIFPRDQSTLDSFRCVARFYSLSKARDYMSSNSDSVDWGSYYIKRLPDGLRIDT